jgi:hypothetical protein
MRIIDDWAPRMPISITDLPVDLDRSLTKLYFAYSPRNLVYYRLGELVIYSFLNREDDYFNEND